MRKTRRRLKHQRRLRNIKALRYKEMQILFEMDYYASPSPYSDLVVALEKNNERLQRLRSSPKEISRKLVNEYVVKQVMNL